MSVNNVSKDVSNAVQRALQNAESDMARADYARAADDFGEALRILEREGDIDDEVRRLIRQIVDWPIGSLTLDEIHAEARRLLINAHGQARNGSQETRNYVQAAERWIEAERRKQLLMVPTSTTVLFGLERANELVERLVRLDPRNMLFIEIWADTRRRLISHQNERALKRISWGEEAFRLGDYDKAIESFKEAFKLKYTSEEVQHEAERLLKETGFVKPIADKFRSAYAKAQSAFHESKYTVAMGFLEQALLEEGAYKAVSVYEYQQLVDFMRVVEQRIAQRRLRMFLCHSSTDKPRIRELYKRLRADGTDPWLDEEALVGGQDWDLEIRKAVRTSDVVLVCLSQNAIERTGYVHKKIRLALDVADEQPEGTIFVIPLRLEECDVPERLKQWHWIDLFEDKGYEKLVNTLKVRAEKIGVLL